SVPGALPRLREFDLHGYVVATARSHAAVRRLQDQRQQADGLHDREVSRPCTTHDEISCKSRAMPSSARDGWRVAKTRTPSVQTRTLPAPNPPAPRQLTPTL